MIPQEIKLLQMLSNNNVTFFIPPYQRNYEWTEDQCSVFLEDIIRTYQDNEAGRYTEHFFGTITFFQTEAAFGQPNKLVLIDGQQRITTTMLFLVAIRDILGEDQIGRYIDTKYLRNDSVTGDSEYKVKLKQVETDWEAYKNIILKIELSTKEKDSAVYRNYDFFIHKLKECLDNGIILGELIGKGLYKFSVITIELKPDINSWENPQEIFESMNSLGKPLSLADLVRNYLLLGKDAETQSILYNQYWMYIENTIPREVSNFIRDYMQFTERRAYPKAKENNSKILYRIFKDVYSQADTIDLMKDLSECATVYSWVLPGGFTGVRVIDNQLRDFKVLKITTAYSFLLALLRTWKLGQFSDAELSQVLEAFRIYCLRRRLVVALTSAENQGLPLLTAKIPDLVKSQDKKQKMFEILSNLDSFLRLPNDLELTRHLETMDFYSFRYCDLYLSLIEEQLTKSRPDLSDPTLQIEHIMPRKLSERWKSALGEEYEETYQRLLNNIGNLTLIRHNQELGNKDFSEKKKIYEDNAGLQIARTRITDCEVWNSKTIQRRTKWIIGFMLSDVLAIPEKMRKANNYVGREGRKLSFSDLGIIDKEIYFIQDPSYRARVIDDKMVEFEGKAWRLSPLTREIQTRRGKLAQAGSYSGAQFWAFDGVRLGDVL